LLRTRIDEVLGIVGLEKGGDVAYMKYSAGMQRKLAISRGILADPPLLLMDEPTIGLDPGSARRIREFLKSELQDSMGKTILFTTHQMQEADKLCDRVAIIDRGRLVACDTPRNLKRAIGQQEIIEIALETPSQGRTDPIVPPSVVSSLEDVQGVTRVLARSDDDSSSPVRRLLILRIACQDARAALQPVITTLTKEGLSFRNIAVVEPTLEDVFINLTEGSSGEGVKDVDKATHVWTAYGRL
jgi:ABC-2 type transport system ATP-binding protein